MNQHRFAPEILGGDVGVQKMLGRHMSDHIPSFSVSRHVGMTEDVRHAKVYYVAAKPAERWKGAVQE